MVEQEGGMKQSSGVILAEWDENLCPRALIPVAMHCSIQNLANSGRIPRTKVSTYAQAKSGAWFKRALDKYRKENIQGTSFLGQCRELSFSKCGQSDFETMCGKCQVSKKNWICLETRSPYGLVHNGAPRSFGERISRTRSGIIFFLLVTTGGDVQNPATTGQNFAVLRLGAGVEHHITAILGQGVQTFD